MDSIIEKMSDLHKYLESLTDADKELFNIKTEYQHKQLELIIDEMTKTALTIEPNSEKINQIELDNVRSATISKIIFHHYWIISKYINEFNLEQLNQIIY